VSGCYTLLARLGPLPRLEADSCSLSRVCSFFPLSPSLSHTPNNSFLALHTIIHPRAVTEFVYRYSSSARAFIYLSFYLSSSSSRPANSTGIATPTGTSTPLLTPQQARQEELQSLLSQLNKGGMQALDLSENEMAKSHARYLVGGRSKVVNERVFRFEFPERPGALRKFLEAMRFNISLFHYRNHGGGESSLVLSLSSSSSSPSLHFSSPFVPLFSRFLSHLSFAHTLPRPLTSHPTNKKTSAKSSPASKSLPPKPPPLKPGSNR
jgi:hypothetical protein